MKINKRVLAGTGLGAVVLVGGTFAYYNQTLSADNPLNTGSYGNELIEEYTPPTEDVMPGATIDKIVGVTNTGDYPVLVRIRMDEWWKRDGEEQPFGEHTSSEKESFNVIVSKQDDADPEKTVWLAYQENDTEEKPNGLTEGDSSVVRKTFSDKVIENLPADDDADAWSALVSDPKWFYAEDGWWYYTDVLDAGEESQKLLEAITLASNIDLGEYIEEDFYAVDKEGLSLEERNAITEWNKYVINENENTIDVYEKQEDGSYPEEPTEQIEDRSSEIDRDNIADLFDLEAAVAGEGEALYRKNESFLNQNAKGYADASYTLKVYSQFVQATPDAILDVFGTGEEGAKVFAADVQKVIDNLDREGLFEAYKETVEE